MKYCSILHKHVCVMSTHSQEMVFTQTSNLSFFTKQMSRNMGKQTWWIVTRSDINQAVQPLEMARGLKFWI